ncbi:TetR family transcriptional regulator C-terminal domain-containing protein [Tsukamurella sp. 8F]|uniref:TetR/AcrR family transcriptional regulator n=1 Tax=unclassified Tsukamurella TaxID=2633480 RepID=UPI0023B89324|nr:MULTISPECIES: TetR family transcriptional regulator C-terminal domain-containing protein [unclassified Tsukamurella]MDF0529185.1 TetR family transcriptional regulator C-terminal domain-containing protein [Tsukamurella sp. 8J]MDF0585370.1 TetR family transcriptional regulator C-terminal domain-containing protein [Tsukamurella sp. 8F]
MVTRRSTGPDDLADAALAVAGRRGLSGMTVRGVADEAGVSIGAVQHHFPTTDALYRFVFQRLAERIRRRIDRDPVARDAGAPVDDRLSAALRHLLPTTVARRREAAVMVEFAARATHSAELAEVQSLILGGIRSELVEILGAHGLPEPDVRAALLLATVDGLALDAVSAPSLYPGATLDACLSRQIAAALTP